MPMPWQRLPVFLRTRIARRILFLFVLSALIPLGVLGVGSWMAVRAELTRQTDEKATLCRCGLSNNKPWCDGRHRKKKDFR